MRILSGYRSRLSWGNAKSPKVKWNLNCGPPKRQKMSPQKMSLLASQKCGHSMNYLRLLILTVLVALGTVTPSAAEFAARELFRIPFGSAREALGAKVEAG